MDSLQSTNWIFLLQVLLVILTWLAARQFYRHSDWLHSNKPVKVNIPRFPRLSFFIQNQLNRNDILIYALVLITLPAILGGVFLIFLFIKGAFSEFEVFFHSISWWGQILIWICFIIVYFFIRIWWDVKKKKSFLNSKKENVSAYGTKNVPQKISEINADRIPTYPRFTMYDLSIENKSINQLIFDSSDFLVISKAFGLLDGFNFNSILQDEYLKFRGEEYLVVKVKVDFLDFFDDYSINTFGGRHTKVYEGKDTPYNIQVIIEARKIEQKQS